MEYRPLGSSGIDVSVLALGCWPFAGGRFWGEQHDEDSIATVHAALDTGINLFDTAEGYEAGHSEDVLGRALTGRRERAVIATKVSASHLSADEVRAACERSLRRLRTDYIDLYQIHWPSRTAPIAETVAALEGLRQQGKVRAVGVCNFAVGDLSELLEVGTVASDQLPYNLLWRTIEDEVLPLCRANGIGVITYSTLAQGLLTGRYASAEEVPDHLARTRHYAGSRPHAQHGGTGCEPEVFAALADIRRVAEQLGEPMARVALAWVRQQPGVTAMLVGARTPAELALSPPSLALTLSGETLRRLAACTETVKDRLGGNHDMWMSDSRMR